MRFALTAAALAGGSAVVIGAAASHGLEARVGTLGAAWIETGLRWQAVHALALLGAAALARPGAPMRWLVAAGWAWTAGILLFSGTLYVMALTGLRGIGVLTPFGGLALIGGWGCMLLHAWRGYPKG